MTWVVVGLGNPDEEHVHTRHNAGRMAVEYFVKENNLSDWKDDAKSNAFIARGAIGKALVVCLLPNTYMNKSGSAVQRYIKSVKMAEWLIVAYDDLDLPLGKIKVSYDRGSGGHKGIESVTRAIKTKKFARIRIGISPVNAKGETKKPQGDRDVEKFVLGDFKKDELPVLKKVLKSVSEAIECAITFGREKAMNEFN